MDSGTRSEGGSTTTWNLEDGGSESEQASTEVISAAAGSDQATGVQDSAPSGSTPAISTSPAPEASSHRKGLLDTATEYINDNIRTFRRLPWIIGGVGVVLLIRYYPRMVFRRYQRPSDVPQQLIENNATLMGIAAMTEWNSVGVWHVPLWRRVLRWRHQPPSMRVDIEDGRSN